MEQFYASFLSRNSKGRFEKFKHSFVADNFEEAISYLYHGERNGKWEINSDITVEKRNGESIIV